MSFIVTQPETKIDTREWLKAMKYRLLTTEREVWDYIEPLKADDDLGVDWETDRLNRFNGPKAVGLGLSRDDNDAVYIPTGHTTDAHLNLPIGFIREVFEEIERRGIYTVYWNWIFDSSVTMANLGLDLTKWQDALLAYWIYDSDQKNYQLKTTSRRFLGVPVIDFDTVTTGRTFAELSPLEATPYVCGDANNCRLIWRKVVNDPWFRAQIQVYERIEKPFAKVFRDEIPGGISIHRGRIEEASRILGETNEDDIPQSGLLLKSYQTVMDLAGETINLRSTPQVGQLLTRLGVEIEEETDSGQVATGADVLARYDHPACQAITDFRQLMALKTNYVDKLNMARDFFKSETLRFPFKQHGAPTGRTACGGDGNNPGRQLEAGYCPINIQSAPKWDKSMGERPNVRKLFTARPMDDPEYNDWEIVAIDYGQLQMRIAANMSKEQKWIDAFNNGHDFHLENAKIAYGAEVGPEKRGEGKTMSFAILFQAKGKTVAQHGKISVEKADELVENFKRGTAQLQTYIDSLKEHAKQYGYIQTVYGRRRRLSKYFHTGGDEKTRRRLEAEGERLAVNTPIQGSEADVAKIAAARCQRLVRDRGWKGLVRQVLWVHDELVFAIHKSISAQAVPLIVEAMMLKVPNWPVPLTAEAGHGDSWGTAKN